MEYHVPKKLVNGVVSDMTEAEETAYNQVQTAHNNLYKQYKVDRTSGFYNEDTSTQTKTIYGRLAEQLDMLYRDVHAGKFGEDAKTGEWYLHVKSVKDDNPK